VLEDVPIPACKPNEVLVRVRAAALNRADLHVAAGGRHGRSGGPGSIIGIEWAGEVVEVGTEVPGGFAVGDAVMCSGTGGYAEYAATDWGRVYRLPDGWRDFAHAAALPVALQTAHDALVGSGGFRAGETVLVQGATSGVGLMTMQVARRLGAALVLGTSTTPERRARLSGYGADLALDSTQNDWPEKVLEATGGAGADLVVDFVAGATVNASMRATRLCGRIVNVGRMGGYSGDFDYDLHSLRRIRYIGATFRTRSLDEVREIARAMRADLWDAVRDGQLRLPISRRFPLADAGEAVACMGANAHFGKVVLDVA
jgi:NADPH2:quinone reductase